ncbi:hypothetical protein [Halobaculum sp. EA56]|uniref:hypothetical protein n=1 Tax=Halobaculum sp. EA56 TaxID=3421648 RepID=UPI003EBF94CF
MSLIENVKDMVTSERRDVYQCDSCGETTRVEVGTEPDACPACDADELTLVNRRAKV